MNSISTLLNLDYKTFKFRILYIHNENIYIQYF